jgi:steroid 5-alpha reductase family enzyme
MILVVAGYALFRGPTGVSPHAGLLFALVFVWCARLVGHASSTNMKVEQEPYANLRRRYGARWPLWSLFAVYALQGAILWVWCATIVMAMSAGDGRLSVLDLIGLAVWGVGFFFQAVGDWQLKQFKRDPANRGKLMQSGLWSLTRHPNYFGESLMWFGYFFFALQHPWGWLTIVSPIYVTWFMGYGSAAPGNERHMRKTRPEYAEYARRVPRLFPRLWPARAA